MIWNDIVFFCLKSVIKSHAVFDLTCSRKYNETMTSTRTISSPVDLERHSIRNIVGGWQVSKNEYLSSRYQEGRTRNRSFFLDKHQVYTKTWYKTTFYSKKDNEADILSVSPSPERKRKFHKSEVLLSLLTQCTWRWRATEYNEKKLTSQLWTQTYLSEVIISAAFTWTIFDLVGSIHTSGFS